LKVKHVRNQYRTLIALLLFLLPVGWQLFAPPYTGLANNGDFGKVSGPLALGPAHPVPQETFHHYIREWSVQERYHLRVTYWGVESWLARAAVWLGGTHPFDLRWLALLHSLVFAASAWAISRQSWWTIAVAVALLTDAAYVTYFASFYFDAAAIAFFPLFIFASWRYEREPSRMLACVVVLAGIGFALSKGPHAPAAIVLGASLWLRRRRDYFCIGTLIVVAALWMTLQTRPEYKATAFYNLVFSKMLPADSQALAKLGLDPELSRLRGTNAFEPQSPAQSEPWLLRFYPTDGYTRVLRYYATNPAVALKFLWSDLRDEANEIRAENLGNYEYGIGKRPGEQSTLFGWVSAFKSALFRWTPWHVLVLIPMLGFAACRAPFSRWCVFAVLFTAAYELAIASLADACETNRHLLLFHLAYDLLIVLAVAPIAKRDTR
jgi:hypothetical protein